jgi:hypothetical protein
LAPAPKSTATLASREASVLAASPAGKEKKGPQTAEKPRPKTVTISYVAGYALTYIVPENLQVEQRPAGLTNLEREVVRVIARSTLPVNAIASRLGQRNNSYLRAVLAHMVERGVLAKSPDGYYLP